MVDSKHTDQTADRFAKEKYAVAAESIVDTDDKKISEYPESRVSLLPTTQFLHGDGHRRRLRSRCKQDGVSSYKGYHKSTDHNGTTLTHGS